MWIGNWGLRKKRFTEVISFLKKLKSLAGFVVATIILVVLLWVAGPEDVYSSIVEADFRFIVLSWVLGVFTILLWSLNWFNFFQYLDIDCSYFRSFQLFATGQFVNCVTPLGRFGGQPLMAYIVSKDQDSNYEKSLATVLSADTIALAPLLIFLLAGYIHFLVTGNFANTINTSAISLSLILAGGLSIGYVGWFKPGNLESGIFRFFNWFTGKTGIGVSYLEGLKNRLRNSEESLAKVGENPVVLFRGLLITIGALTAKTLSLITVFYAVGIQFNPMHAMLLVPLIALANISPTPGGAGTFEAAMTALILIIIDIETSTALTVAILYRLATYWVTVLVGYLASTTLSYKVTKEKIEEKN